MCFTEIQAVFAEELMPTAAAILDRHVGVIDESGFVKAGKESVGVAHQWCGRLGKSTNCQVGCSWSGVTPGGTAFLDAQLFLTEECAADKAHRQKTRVPKEVEFQTKPQIAAEMIRADSRRGQGAFRLDHGRRIVRLQRRLPRRLGGDGPAVRGGGQEEHDRVYRRSGDPARCLSRARRSKAEAWLLPYPQVRSVEKVAASLAARSMAAAGLAGRGEGAVGA